MIMSYEAQILHFPSRICIRYASYTDTLRYFTDTSSMYTRHRKKIIIYNIETLFIDKSKIGFVVLFMNDFKKELRLILLLSVENSI